MDLIPINVLADSKAAPSSLHAAPAKQSFADVLSAHPQPSDHRSAPQTKTDQSQSHAENKQLDRKAKTANARKSDQNQRDLEPQAIANPVAVIPVPALTPARVLSLDTLAASLSAIDPSATKDSVEETKASQTNATGTPGALGTPAAANNAAPVDQEVKTAATKPSSTTDSSHSKLPTTVAAHATHASQVEPAAVDAIVPADSEIADSTPAAANNQTVTESKAQADEVKALTASVMPTAVANVAATPMSSELARAQTSASEKEPATNANSSAQNANSDQPMMALAAAAEKIGAVISTTVHVASKPVAVRPMISALKAAVAPVTHDNPTGSQESSVVPARSGEPGHRHSDAQKQDTDPAQLNQSAVIDTKTLVDEIPKDPIPSTVAPAKDGAGSVLSAAGLQAAAAQPKNGMQSSPGGSSAPASATQQEAATLALNRANIAAGMELSGLSKTSLIERFRQSELHFGMQSGEFGHIEVRTLLDHHEVTARISVEHGDLSRALESELPGLQKRLGDLDVPAAKITLHEQSAAMSGDSGRRSKEQEWQSWQQQPFTSTLESHPTMPAVLEPSIVSEGLSIRI